MKTDILPDFIEMTNYCENLGYEIDMIRSRKGITCDVYKRDELFKVGTIVYQNCVDAQKESYSKIYIALNQ